MKKYLQIILIVLLANLGFSQTLVDEKFEGTAVPLGWTLQSTLSDPLYTWTFYDSYDDFEVYASDTNVQNEWLISPSYNLTTYSNLYLTFSPWMYVKRSDFTANVFNFNVLVSSNGGTTWTNLWSNSLLTLDNFDQRAFYDRTISKSLQNYCGLNMNNVKIAFQFTSNVISTDLNFVALQDVKISTDCPVTTLSKFNSNAISWFPIDNFSGTFDLEYGPIAFSQGSGTLVTGLSGTSYVFPAVMSKFDCYIRTNCGSSTSEWSKMTFYNRIQELTNSQTTSSSNTINWLGYSNYYQIEYGLGNFTQGTGTFIDDAVGNSYGITGLSANAFYTCYVRSKSVTPSQNVNGQVNNSSNAFNTNSTTVFGPWLSNTFTTTSLANSSFHKLDFSISPNPTQNSLTIKTDEKINTIHIIDILGRKTNITNFENNKIDVSNLQNGVYFLEIADENGLQIEKFIKN
jgi:hypothetical protein